MTKKTPIVDKICGKLKLIEKIQSSVPLPNKLDTGIDSDPRTQVWNYVDKKWDETLGLDKIRDVFGADDANVIHVPSSYRSEKGKNVDKALSNNLFGGTRTKRVDLLDVKEAPSAQQESLSPYYWKPTQVDYLVEDTITPVSNIKDTPFYRFSDGNIIFTRNIKHHPTCYYTIVPTSPKVDDFIHNGFGAPPKNGTGSIKQLQTYAAQQYKEILAAAIEQVKTFAKDEESTAMLDQLKTLSAIDLPIIIFDSLMLGIIDAVNIGTHKTNIQFSDDQPKNRVGWQVLEPVSVMPWLENALSKTASAINENETAELTPALQTKIEQSLLRAKTINYPYDPIFREQLIEAMEMRKFNIEKISRNVKTTLLFVLAQITNQMNRVLGVKPSSLEASSFYWSHFGFTDKRVSEFERVVGHALVSTNCPVIVLRGRSGSKTSAGSDVVFLIESHIIDYDIKKASPTAVVLPLKPIGITSMVHNYVYSRAAKTYGSLTKKSYIDYFTHNITAITASIQGAIGGPEYWSTILNAIVPEDPQDILADKFNEGIFFVGLSPLFWDAEKLGKTIKVSVDKGDITKTYKLPYLRNDDGKYSKHWGYSVSSAAELSFDRLIDQRFDDLDPDSQECKDWLQTSEENLQIYPEGSGNDEAPQEEILRRHTEILDRFSFVSLSELRNSILQHLYNENTAIAERELTSIVEDKIATLYKNVSEGFWSISDSGIDGQLAAYNAWIFELAGNTKTATKFRFIKDNTNPLAIKSGRSRVKDATNEARIKAKSVMPERLT